MKKTMIIGGVVAGALLSAGQALAAPITIDGINFSSGPSFQVGSIYENTAAQVGQTLSGFGRINSINSNTNFCAGGLGSCELTFTFSGYTATAFSPDGSNASFEGGTLNFYADSSPDFGRGGSMATAGNGDLFLSTSGHQFTDEQTGRTGTLLLQGANAKTDQFQGTTIAQLNVTGGDAGHFFDTDTQNDHMGGTSDLLFNGSFSGSGCPANGEPMCGSGDVHSVADVPEPSQLGLMGLGLFLIGFSCKSRRRHLETSTMV